MSNCTRLHTRTRALVALSVSILVLAVALIRPTLGKHHYGEFYRVTGYYHGPARHLTLDVTDSAPDLQPLDLGWTGRLALSVSHVSPSMDHWHALDPVVDDAPPGSLLHRKIGPSRADDPDLLA